MREKKQKNKKKHTTSPLDFNGPSLTKKAERPHDN